MTNDEVPGGKQKAGAGPRRSDGPDQAGAPGGQGSHPGGRPARPRRPADMESNPGVAWNVVGTLGAGIAFWGFVGWGIDRLTHLHHVFLPIGILLGLAAAIYLVIYQALRR
ncbi:AtpZ/AtpI family protein [Frankia sp. AgB1.9]|uniref:AtpZ/AtpI family protein n=1 Tax=unclassified Frankia TaxID=2632575 RepID=UPI0019339DB2|nr:MULTISPECIES: AtpZ/AtpI family protein [unclassified Frankia]MBL7493146.1 AtpZ/AtpI family protein [Frankia sp. AgW1.1]MBL7549894.1 AtpZ/AtpI family protein [Frankia sp. AgB1.9]MBL7620500.1 AtpZ/AtpI family protein [Frankia sp. AgB1.8]